MNAPHWVSFKSTPAHITPVTNSSSFMGTIISIQTSAREQE